MADVRALAPASILVRFPRADDGVVGAETYDVTVTLAALGLAPYADRPGFDGVQVLHAGTVADFAGGSLTSDPAALDSRAAQLATDFYLYRLANVAAVWAGAASWEPEGLSDWVEWLYRRGEVSCRVEPPAWNLGVQDWGALTGPPGPPGPAGDLVVELLATVSYPNITLIQFDPADGVTLSSDAAGQVLVHITLPSTITVPVTFVELVTMTALTVTTLNATSVTYNGREGLTETVVLYKPECEEGRLRVYAQELLYEAGGLVEMGEFQFAYEAGCCDCPETPPVEDTGCCTGAVPGRLFATLSGAGCFAGGVNVQLDYHSSMSRWEGVAPVTCGEEASYVHVEVHCDASFAPPVWWAFWSCQPFASPFQVESGNNFSTYIQVNPADPCASPFLLDTFVPAGSAGCGPHCCNLAFGEEVNLVVSQ